MLLRRLAARFLDNLLGTVFLIAVAIILFLAAIVAGVLPAILGWPLLLIVSIAALLGYWLLLWVNTVDLPAVRGQSVGKKRAQVVIDFSNSRFSSLHTASFVRELVLSILGPIALITCIFNEDRRGLHDMAAGTTVRRT